MDYEKALEWYQFRVRSTPGQWLPCPESLREEVEGPTLEAEEWFREWLQLWGQPS